MRDPTIFEIWNIEKREEYLNTPISYTYMGLFTKDPYLIVSYPNRDEIIEKNEEVFKSIGD